MNIWIGSGNVCKDPEIHTTNGGIKKANFTLAVQRKFPNAQGVREADFFPIVVWRQLAETVEKYVTKGMKLGIQGYLQRRDYDAQDGSKRTVTEIIADSIEFLSPKDNSVEKTAETTEKSLEKVAEMTETEDRDLPF